MRVRVFIAVTALALHGCTDTGDADADLKPTTRKERTNKRKERRDETEESEDDDVRGGKDSSSTVIVANTPPYEVHVARADSGRQIIVATDAVPVQEDRIVCADALSSFATEEVDMGLCGDGSEGYVLSRFCALSIKFDSPWDIPASVVFRKALKEPKSAGCIKPVAGADPTGITSEAKHIDINGSTVYQVTCTKASIGVFARYRMDNLAEQNKFRPKALGNDANAYCAGIMEYRTKLVEKNQNIVLPGIYTPVGFLAADRHKDRFPSLTDLYVRAPGCSYRFNDVDPTLLMAKFNFPEKTKGTRKIEDRGLLGCLGEPGFEEYLLPDEAGEPVVGKVSMNADFAVLTCTYVPKKGVFYGKNKPIKIGEFIAYGKNKDLVDPEIRTDATGNMDRICAKFVAARAYFLSLANVVVSAPRTNGAKEVIPANLRRSGYVAAAGKVGRKGLGVLAGTAIAPLITLGGGIHFLTKAHDKATGFIHHASWKSKKNPYQ